jgi:hypothetical protein
MMVEGGDQFFSNWYNSSFDYLSSHLIQIFKLSWKGHLMKEEVYLE